MRLFAGAVLATTIMLAGCASSRIVNALPDYQGADAVTLYLQRPPGIAGGVAGTSITIDGRFIGYLGVGEYWIVKLKPGRHGLETSYGTRGYNWKANSVHCIVLGLAAFQGGYINPAEHCPPPKKWRLAAESASLKGK